MTWTEFLSRYAETEAQLQTYVEGLPLWVNVWRGWMFFIFTVAIVFVFSKPAARWLGLTMIASLFAYNVVSMLHGVGRFPSIAFVALWTPLAVYFARHLGEQPQAGRFDGAYRLWFRAALATLVVSLAFDTYNVAFSVLTGVP